MSERRRRRWWWLLPLAFVVVPLVEIYVIVQVGQVIGAWWTILLLIADSIFGAWLVKREGRRAWGALQVALSEHRMPARELADGVLVLTGGILMLTPGFVLDILGVLFILPLTRPVGRRLLTGLITRRLLGQHGVAQPGAGQPGWAGGASGPGGRGDSRRGDSRRGPTTGHDVRPGGASDDVVQGDVVDPDDS